MHVCFVIYSRSLLFTEVIMVCSTLIIAVEMKLICFRISNFMSGYVLPVGPSATELLMIGCCGTFLLLFIYLCH